MKTFGIVLGVLLGLAGLAAFVVPPMLDWNRYRATLAELVSDRLGREVHIDGALSLALLPEPTLTAARITLADAGDGVSITVAELRLRLALGPLLRGQVDAQELVIVGPAVRLPWPLDAKRLQLRAPDWLAQISARVEGGRVSLGQVAVDRIDATLGTLDTGSYAAAGTARFSGQTWHMTARLTRTGADGAAGLDLTMDGQGAMQGLGGAFSGQMAADGALSGRINGRGPDLSRLLPAPAVAFRADGRLDVAAGLALAHDLSIDIAGSPARGAVSLGLGVAPRLDVSLAASRIDLDAWLAALLTGDGAALPIATGIDLSAEAASLASGTLRALRGRFDLGGGRITLNGGEAVLPGDATLRLVGAFSRPEKRLVFEGSGSLEAPSLRTTLAWLDAAGLGLLDAMPAEVLRQASLTARVSAGFGARPEVTLADLSGQIDGQALRARLTVKPGTRLAIETALNLATLDLDPWWPSALPGRGRVDLDLQLATDRLRFRGQDIARLTLDLASQQGRVQLRKSEAVFPGLRAVASFTLLDGGELNDARLELAAPALDAAAAGVAALLPLPAAMRLPHWPLALVLVAAGPPGAIAARLTMDAGDLRVEAQPLIDTLGQRLSGTMMLRHPGAPRLLEALGLGGTASWLGDGSLSLVAGMAVSRQKILVDSFGLAAGVLRAGGSLTLEPGETPRLTGRITAETLPLPLPFPRSPDPLPLALLAGWEAGLRLEAGRVLAGLSPVIDHLATQLSVKDGALRLDTLTGLVDGGAASGAIGLDTRAVPPRLSVELALAGAKIAGPLFELPLDIASGTLDATASLTAQGHAPQALLATLSGTAHLAVQAGTITGVDPAAMGPGLLEDDLRRALMAGSFAFDQLDLLAGLANGALTLAASSIIAPSGTGRLTGLVDIAGQTQELRLAWRPGVEQPPELAVRLGGRLGQNGRTLETSEGQIWRALHP